MFLSQVRAHQLVLPPCEVVIKAVSEYVSSIKDLGNLDAIARDVFKQSQVRHAAVFQCFLLLLIPPFFIRIKKFNIECQNLKSEW